MQTPFSRFLLATTLVLLCAVSPDGSAQTQDKGMKGVYSFTMKKIDGTMTPLASYKGKVLLIVNTASFCGYTKQYATLEALYRAYKDRGFEILGFPANNFGEQEPGTDEEIKTFCSTKYDVSFDMFSKISVKGDDIHPLYTYLTREAGHNGDITWNFNKFLVDRDGKVIARYGQKVDPMSEELKGLVETLTEK